MELQDRLEELRDQGFGVAAISYDSEAVLADFSQRRGITFPLLSDEGSEIITEFGGKKPRGWFGPGLTQTFQTLDHLAAAGLEYFGDWVIDDQPVPVRTEHGPIVALPYNYEIHDIVLMAIQHHPSEVYRNRALDYFETIYAESKDTARIMAIAMHPYLSGSPHRIRYVRETLEHILSQPGVVCWDGEQILDWFLKESPLEDVSK